MPHSFINNGLYFYNARMLLQIDQCYIASLYQTNIISCSMNVCRANYSRCNQFLMFKIKVSEYS